MTAVSDTDLSAIEHLDWAEQEPCSFDDKAREGKCGASAEWLGVCKEECGASSACCDTHRLWLLAAPYELRCKKCGVTGLGIDIVRFVRLDGAS